MKPPTREQIESYEMYSVNHGDFINLLENSFNHMTGPDFSEVSYNTPVFLWLPYTYICLLNPRFRSICLQFYDC